MSQPEFDVSAAHEHFSVQCFNKAWELLDTADRSPEEDEQLIRLALASHWHWTQREDCTAANVSVGYWQTSRVYAVLGQADNAGRYAELCLRVSREGDVSPFYRGYAYEAMARAAHIAGDRQAAEQHLARARSIAEDVAKDEWRQWLLDDLDTIE